jgi:hypothetical protein
MLEEDGRRCALVGGLAVSTRAEPRFTRDVDFAVAVAGDEDAEAAVRQFLSAGYRLEASLEHEDSDRLSGVRLIDPDGISIDLLFASSGVEDELVASSERLEIAEGLWLPVAGVGYLIALKLLSVDEDRATDRADLRALAGVATQEDWADSARAVGLIEERGFNWGRDLVAALRALRPS